jgi:hypothetical protein
MSRLLLATVLFCAIPAQADDLARLLLDYEQSKVFCAQHSPSILTIGVRSKAVPGLDPRTLPTHFGTAVAVRDETGTIRILAATLFARGGEEMFIGLPSDKSIVVPAMKTLGDGALVELLVDPKALPDSLVALPLYAADPVRATMPVFTIINAGTQFPILIRGMIVDVLRGVLQGILVTNIPLPYATPLLSASGHLVAINYRQAPKRDEFSMAISAETLREWLRSESSTTHPDPPAR